LKINGFTRKLGIKFIAADSHGFFGYIFCDLLEHTYVEEKKQLIPGKKDESEIVVSQKVEKYVSFEQTLQKKWTTVPLKKQKKISHALFAFQVLHRFQENQGRLPNSESAEDFALLLKTRKEHFAQIEAEEQILEDQHLKQFVAGVGAEIAPVTAIMGGFLAQEIIKVLSGKDLPVSNYFLFDNVGIGSVELLE